MFHVSLWTQSYVTNVTRIGLELLFNFSEFKYRLAVLDVKSLGSKSNSELWLSEG